MAEVKKINVGPALTLPLALACRGCEIANEGLEKLALAKKFEAVKEHSVVVKIMGKADMLWMTLGLVLIFHGAQFKSLFICTQVIMTFCYSRVKGSIVSLHSDITTACDKISADEVSAESNADAKAEAKPESKHAQKRAAKKDGDKPTKAQQEEDAAATKKLLKVLDSDKVTAAFFEICASAMACHMAMEGGLVKVAVVAHALVKASKEKLSTLLEFSGHEDMQAWTELFMTFLLYVVFGAMALVAAPLAFAINLAFCGAQLVTEHGLRIAESMGKIPDGASAEAFASSPKGMALLGGLTAFGTLWQFWALVADSGMAWYFKMLYCPACLVECIISCF